MTDGTMQETRMRFLFLCFCHRQSYSLFRDTRRGSLFVGDCRVGVQQVCRSKCRKAEYTSNPCGTRRDKMRSPKKHAMPLIVAISLSSPIANADTVIIGASPSIVRRAEAREAIRQHSTWTAENIQKNPYLFLKDQVADCDRLRAKIEAQNITLIRLEKRSARAVEESDAMRARYEKFLADAKTAYKAANGKWPVAVNGYELSEDELNDRIADAMERVELAAKERQDNLAIGRKVSIRKGILKTRKRELASLRRKLVLQSEQVKMDAALAELGDLQSSLGTLQDMMLEIDNDPTKLSVADLTEEDIDEKRNSRIRAFLSE